VKRILLALALLVPLVAHSQNTLTFSASTTTGDGSVVPALTWSTSPAAASCTASGAPNWTGTKAASGTQTLPAITSSATYNLDCTWPGDSIVTFSWTNPTTNTDGSAYTDAKSVRIQYTFGATAPAAISGTAPCTATSTPACAEVSMPASMRTVTGISQTGTLRGVAQACNQRDQCSVVSNAATKTFTGNVTVNRSVGITVNPVPGPVTAFGAQ
jgi:hypothetical protein